MTVTVAAAQILGVGEAAIASDDDFGVRCWNEKVGIVRENSGEEGTERDGGNRGRLLAPAGGKHFNPQLGNLQ